jgi:uncharacterized damage-inducible protein DinB
MPQVPDDPLDPVRRLLEHMAWTDRRILRRIADAPRAEADATLRLVGHLLAAERVWLLRLTGGDASAQPVWPALEVEALAPLAEENAAGFAEWVDALDAAGFHAEVAYTNTGGTAFRTPVLDVLLHVALHGSYHRGQIAAALRRDGGEPVNTDYITFVRERAAAPDAASREGSTR